MMVSARPVRLRAARRCRGVVPGRAPLGTLTSLASAAQAERQFGRMVRSAKRRMAWCVVAVGWPTGGLFEADDDGGTPAGRQCDSRRRLDVGELHLVEGVTDDLRSAPWSRTAVFNRPGLAISGLPALRSV